MLQKNKRDAACMYVHTSFGTYSDRRVLCLLLCAGVIARCCAVLYFVMLVAQRQHTYSYMLLPYCCCGILVQHKKRRKTKRKMKAQHCHKMLEKMLALAISVCLLALSSGMYEREITAKHGTARHSVAQHGIARQGAAPHGTGRRCIAPLG